MPRGPKGESRPADTHVAAIKAARISVGEDEDKTPSVEDEDKTPSVADEGKNPAAVVLGRMGGNARAKGLSAKQRKDIARKAAQSRWSK